MATWTETTGDISGDWFVISEFLVIMKWEDQSINILYIYSYEHKHACVQGCVKAQTYNNLVIANFFLISKKIILKKHKKTKTTQRIQRWEQKREKKRKEKNKITRKPTKTNYKEEN